MAITEQGLQDVLLTVLMGEADPTEALPTDSTITDDGESEGGSTRPDLCRRRCDTAQQRSRGAAVGRIAVPAQRRPLPMTR